MQLQRLRQRVQERVLVIQLLQLLPRLVHGNSATATVAESAKKCTGNSATATSASKCTGNSATATKLATARSISVSGAVSGSANFDGSANISIVTKQNNVFILNGNLLSGNQNINYPTGLNVDNCVVISSMIRNGSNTTGSYTTGSIFTSSSYVLGGIPHIVILNNTNISIRVRNINLTAGEPVYTNEITSLSGWKYKIVLMKIS